MSPHSLLIVVGIVENHALSGQVEARATMA